MERDPKYDEELLGKFPRYAFNSPDFTFVEHVSANERVIELGAKKILMVYTGEVGISYDHGELRILSHGRHVIDSSTHLFEGFLSTQQRSLRLVTMSREQSELRKKNNAVGNEGARALGSSTSSLNLGHPKKKVLKPEDMEDMMVCETKDLVKVGKKSSGFLKRVSPNGG